MQISFIFREKSLASRSGANSKAEDPELPTRVPPQPRMKPPGGITGSSSYGGVGGDDTNGGCYVPDGGFPFNSRF